MGHTPNIPNALPKLPSPGYALELAATHLWHEGMAVDMTVAAFGRDRPTGAHAEVVRVMDAAETPADLRAPYDKWHMGGHFGEIGKTALVLEHSDVPSIEEQKTALHRGAVAMTLLGITDTVASAPDSRRSAENSGKFFDNIRRVLLTGRQPHYVYSGLSREKAAYDFARAAGGYLHLETVGDQVDALLVRLRDIWLERLALSEPGKGDPMRLFNLAKQTGEVGVRLAAVTVLGRDGHPALRQLGAIGGLEEHKTTEPAGGIATYASAAAQRDQLSDYVGREWAVRARRREQLTLYRRGWAQLTNKRHRQVFQTVTFFATSPWSHP
ncbi:MAG TPA: hypothetical protein VF466_04365 [Candidatus Saccharimonadales bacterium]